MVTILGLPRCILSQSFHPRLRTRLFFLGFFSELVPNSLFSLGPKNFGTLSVFGIYLEFNGQLGNKRILWIGVAESVTKSPQDISLLPDGHHLAHVNAFNSEIVPTQKAICDVIYNIKRFLK